MRPGDAVLLRGVFRERVRWATPHRLVELTDERVVAFLAVGTPGIRPDNYARKPYVEQLLDGWNHVVGPWQTHHVLRVTPFAAAHSVDLFFSEDWHFVCWYVNLQEPLRATRLGFDTFDQQLDIVVAPDGRWEWKDEQEFEDLRGTILEPAAHDAVRAEGERVVRDIEAWRAPFDEGWEDWRPPAGWTVPELPEEWRAGTR
jgi:hypothetical protein